MHGSNSAFVGTELGIFSTTNLNSDNPTWGADMQNIGDIAVTEIRQQIMDDYHILNKGVIYIATYGSGIWMDTTYAIPVGIEPVIGNLVSQGLLNVNPNPVVDNLTITYTCEVSGNLTATVYDLSGRTILARNFGIQPKGVFKGQLNLGSLKSGSYILKVGNGHQKVVKL
jgi:hypothetical protein